MNFVEKKNIHDRLLGVTHMDADRELLKKHSPDHKLIGKRTFNPLSDASSLLWALLDFASENEILNNRRSIVASGSKAEEESVSAKVDEEPAPIKVDEEVSEAKTEGKPALAEAEEEASAVKAEEMISDAKDEAEQIIDDVEAEAEEIRSAAKKDVSDKKNHKRSRIPGNSMDSAQ